MTNTTLIMNGGSGRIWEAMPVIFVSYQYSFGNLLEGQRKTMKMLIYVTSNLSSNRRRIITELTRSIYFSNGKDISFLMMTKSNRYQYLHEARYGYHHSPEDHKLDLHSHGNLKSHNSECYHGV
jgi:hypothetical protein